MVNKPVWEKKKSVEFITVPAPVTVPVPVPVWNFGISRLCWPCCLFANTFAYPSTRDENTWKIDCFTAHFVRCSLTNLYSLFLIFHKKYIHMWAVNNEWRCRSRCVWPYDRRAIYASCTLRCVSRLVMSFLLMFQPLSLSYRPKRVGRCLSTADKKRCWCWWYRNNELVMSMLCLWKLKDNILTTLSEIAN